MKYRDSIDHILIEASGVSYPQADHGLRAD